MNIASDGGGASIANAQGVFMGQQSLVRAWGRRPRLIMKDFDYEDEHGIAYSMIQRTNKPVFDDEDYGSFGVVSARSRISDAV